MASNKMLFPPLNAELNSERFHLESREFVASVQCAQRQIQLDWRPILKKNYLFI